MTVPSRAAGISGPTAVAAAGIVLLTLAAFWPVTRNGFVGFDDQAYITQNEVVRRGLTGEGLALALTHSYKANWHPLTWISHMIDVELFGMDPRGHHAVNLALHAAGAILLLRAVQLMTGRTGFAFVVAALFAAHPLRVESVAWAAERKDVLCGLFWMATLLAWARYARRPTPLRYGATVVLFVLALAAKPMAVTLPLILLLLDFWPLGRTFGTWPLPALAASGRSAAFLVLEKTPLAALSALASLLTLKAQGIVGPIFPKEVVPVSARVANALESYLVYLKMAALPRDLAVIYPRATIRLSDPTVLAAAALLLAGTTMFFALRRSRPWLLVGWGWYLIALVPVIGLVPVGDQSRADRYTYLPLIGIALLVCRAMIGISGGRTSVQRALRVAAIIVIGAFALLTQRQTGFWRTTRVLFEHTVQVTRDNWKALYCLGSDLARAGDLGGSVAPYREVMRLKPGFHLAASSLVANLVALGRIDEAIAVLQHAVADGEPDPALLLTLSELLAEVGRDREAIARLRELVRLYPRFAEANNNLAVLLARGGEREEATQILRSILQFDPEFEAARRNLEALGTQGQ